MRRDEEEITEDRLRNKRRKADHRADLSEIETAMAVSYEAEVRQKSYQAENVYLKELIGSQRDEQAKYLATKLLYRRDAKLMQKGKERSGNCLMKNLMKMDTLILD